MPSKSLRRKFDKAKFHTQLARFNACDIAPSPTFIQLEHTVRCNLECINCTRGQLVDTYQKIDLTLDEIKKIVELFPNLETIKLQGLGEPLLHPKIRDILAYLHSAGIRVMTISNGTLFNTQRHRDTVLEYLSDVVISIDSVDSGTFNRLRKNANLFKILEGIRQLIQDRNQKNPNVLIGINYVVSAANHHELPELYDLAVGLGIDFVAVVEVENWMIDTETGFRESAEFVAQARQYSKQIKKECSKLFYRLLARGILFGHVGSEMRFGNCYWPYKSMFITVEGLVTPCCIRMHRGHAFGNILEVDTLNEIWNGPTYREFRRSHMTRGAKGSLCKTCPN